MSLKSWNPKEEEYEIFEILSPFFWKVLFGSHFVNNLKLTILYSEYKHVNEGYRVIFVINDRVGAPICHVGC